jgi:hypothetical protein
LSDIKFKPSGALKKFLKVDKNTRVLSSVERHFIAKPKAEDRRQDVIHPSEMVSDSWCHRAQYFKLIGQAPTTPKDRGVNLKKRLIFEEGHAIHRKWQDIFFECGTLYGKWHCSRCSNLIVGVSPTCNLCGLNDKLTYKEVPLSYDPYKISGHADGILIGYESPLLLEIKSIGQGTFVWEDPEYAKLHDHDLFRMWADLDKPFMKHINQAQVYMKLCELMDLEIQPQEACFIYELKANQEYKEFIVPKSDFSISHLLEAAKMISAAVDSRTPPKCNMGGSQWCGECGGYDDQPTG